MNQEKIGKFIAELRKENNMTQLELADKLGITDRAISKWENGRGMPDVSLLKPLCEILGISVNELLSAQKLNCDEQQEKFEENIVNTIDYTNRKIKKTEKITIIFLSLLLSLLIILITLFVIDINRMRNNKPVLFSTWGYSYAPAIDIKETEIENAIIEYVNKKETGEPTHNQEGKNFSSMRVYLIEETEKNICYNIYAWVLSEKYYLRDGEIIKDSGSSVACKFTVENIDEVFVVTDFRTPQDGTLYADDMKNIFPVGVRNDMDEVYTDGTIQYLQSDIKEQTTLYFHK